MFELITYIAFLPAWVLWIVAAFAMAWLIHLLAPRLANRIIRWRQEVSLKRWPSRLKLRPLPLRPERQQTLQSLIASPISFIAFAAAVLFSLAHFIGWINVTVLTGVISAAFGLAAGPLIRDLLTGFNLIFEDVFDIGEKVEIISHTGSSIVEGIIEGINVRTTSIRAPGGELYVVPHGEIRIVRNFSRGDFATTRIKLKVAAADLNQTLSCLKELGAEAVILLPNLVEPWEVISESGAIGQHIELIVVAKTRFGQATELHLRLLALVQERLAAAGINLVD